MTGTGDGGIYSAGGFAGLFGLGASFFGDGVLKFGFFEVGESVFNFLAFGDFNGDFLSFLSFLSIDGGYVVGDLSIRPRAVSISSPGSVRSVIGGDSIGSLSSFLDFNFFSDLLLDLLTAPFFLGFGGFFSVGFPTGGGGSYYLSILYS